LLLALVEDTFDKLYINEGHTFFLCSQRSGTIPKPGRTDHKRGLAGQFRK